MTWNKLIHHIMLIAAFVCLVMCPSAHALSDNVRLDFVYKVVKKTLQKDFKSGSNVSPVHLSNNNQNDIFVQSKDAQKPLILSPPHVALNLSILSIVRLIL